MRRIFYSTSLFLSLCARARARARVCILIYTFIRKPFSFFLPYVNKNEIFFLTASDVINFCFLLTFKELKKKKERLVNDISLFFFLRQKQNRFQIYI